MVLQMRSNSDFLMIGYLYGTSEVFFIKDWCTISGLYSIYDKNF